MFPARAGMSRDRRVHESAATHVPRASGDEPLRADGIEGIVKCSPRERG